MLHNKKLYPQGDPSVFDVLGLKDSDSQAQEVWLDLNQLELVDINHAVFAGCERIIIYDFFHARPGITPGIVDSVRALRQIAPVHWVSTHHLRIDDIPTVRFDYLWNRTRRAYLEHSPSWKHGPDPADYVQYPLHWQPRSHRYLCLYNRPEPFRDRLHRMVQHYQGYWSNRSLGKWLEPNSLNTEDFTLLPRREYLDTSYISCQVESTHLSGLGIGFTEKTYDHLIQGRIVLNFGPAGFYQQLACEGWQLYHGIDLAWDGIANDEMRFLAYINCLECLFRLSDLDMHDLFLLNKEIITHNYRRLEEKPYDYFNGISSS